MMRILPDYESLSHAAAELIAKQSHDAIEARGRFSLVLSGGHTPRRTYELLATKKFRTAIEWRKVHIFWGDERCVPPDDERSNERMARKAFLDRVPIPKKHVHPMRCADSPSKAARAYEAILKKFFGNRSSSFDLVLLGLGEDGHTASLFPGSSVLKETRRWVMSSSSGKEDFERVTLTAPLINLTRLIVFLESGKAKSKILRKVIAKEATDDPPPARLIHPLNGELMWMVDNEAAGIV
jgi:6-phosphogluconolactonase